MSRIQKTVRALKLFHTILYWFLLDIKHLSNPIDYTTLGMNSNIALGDEISLDSHWLQLLHRDSISPHICSSG